MIYLINRFFSNLQYRPTDQDYNTHLKMSPDNNSSLIVLTARSGRSATHHTLYAACIHHITWCLVAARAFKKL